MKIFNKSSLKVKLLILFSILILLIAGGLIFGIATMRSNHTSYVYLLDYPVERMEYYGEAKYAVMGMRRAHLTFYLYESNEELTLQSYNESLDYANEAIRNLEMCYNNLQNDIKLNKQIKENYSGDIRNTIDYINTYMDNYVTPAYSSSIQSKSTYNFVVENSEKGIAQANLIITNLDKMFLRNKNLLDSTAVVAFNSANYLIIQMIVVFAAILIIIMLLFFIIANEVATPIKNFIEKLIKIDYANLDVDGKREINDLIKTILG